VPEAWTKGTFYGTLAFSVCCSCTTFWPVQKALQGEALQLFLRVFTGQGVSRRFGRQGLGSPKDGQEKQSNSSRDRFSAPSSRRVAATHYER